MVKKLLYLCIVLSLLLTGCTNKLSNQGDYENLSKEIDDLKEQIESIQDEDNQIQENDILESEASTIDKEMTWDFSFEYDENNSSSISVSGDSNGNLMVSGFGEYENLGLLQLDYTFISKDFYTGLLGVKEIEFYFNFGENKYQFVVSDGAVVTDTVPMENKEPTPYELTDKIMEHFEKIMDYKNTIITELNS